MTGRSQMPIVLIGIDFLPMSDTNLKTLEAKIDELIAFAAHLQQENKSLRERESNLLTERASLIEKNQVVRQRVETIVSRLKAMQDN